MRHGKRDRQHAAIVAALRAAGYSVLDLADLGQGCPDILVGRAGQTFGPFELKSPDGQLTPAEATWWANWRGGGAVVYSLAELLSLLDALAT